MARIDEGLAALDEITTDSPAGRAARAPARRFLAACVKENDRLLALRALHNDMLAERGFCRIAPPAAPGLDE